MCTKICVQKYSLPTLRTIHMSNCSRIGKLGCTRTSKYYIAIRNKQITMSPRTRITCIIFGERSQLFKAKTKECVYVVSFT